MNFKSTIIVVLLSALFCGICRYLIYRRPISLKEMNKVFVVMIILVVVGAIIFDSVKN